MVTLPPLALLTLFSPQKALNLAEIQQFCWLMPLAAWVGQGYRHSAVRESLYRAPWTFGVVGCISLFALVLLVSKPPNLPDSPWPAVTAKLRQYPLVLSAGLSNAMVSEINYYSYGYAHILAVPPSQQTNLLGLLKQQPVPILATANQLPNLNISASAPAPLLLFQPTPNGATLLAKWNITP
jgi:hypothetical protein